MRAVLTETQATQLQELNTSEGTFVACWSDLGGVTINDTDFDGVGFEAHKALMITFKLKWVADAQ